MDNPKSAWENETHNLHWDFEIQMDHQILARRHNLEIVKKKENIRFCLSSWTHSKTEGRRKERDKYLDLARELKNYAT